MTPETNERKKDTTGKRHGQTATVTVMVWAQAHRCSLSMSLTSLSRVLPYRYHKRVRLSQNNINKETFSHHLLLPETSVFLSPLSLSLFTQIIFHANQRACTYGTTRLCLVCVSTLHFALSNCLCNKL